MAHKACGTPEVSIQDLQPLGGVIITIEPEAAVAWVVVLCVELLELLKGELRDDCWVTTRVMLVGVVREQSLSTSKHQGAAAARQGQRPGNGSLLCNEEHSNLGKSGKEMQHGIGTNICQHLAT